MPENMRSLKGKRGPRNVAAAYRWPVGLVVAVLIAAAVVLATPRPVSAHALLVSSTPGSGDVLGTAPGAVVLEFSEALNSKLSSASVIDPGGHHWAGAVTSSGEMRVPLVTNAQGSYAVDWSSVSLDDGHQVSGSFRFGVRVSSASAGTGNEGSIGQPTSSDLLIGIAKWIEALALIALVGQLLVARLARIPPALRWVRPRLAVAALALAAGLVVVWGEANIATGGHSLAAYASYFTTGLSGIARLARLGFELLLLLAAIQSWRSVWLWVLGALVALAASGHAGDVHPAWFGVGVDSIHLAAAGFWAGGILALATQRPPEGWRSEHGRALLVRFTPPALTAFTVTVGAGVIQAIQQLGSWSAFVETAYGEVLLGKIALVGLMLPLSLLAWRRRRPRLRTEASLAAGVVAAAAILAAFPLPPTEAARQLALQASGQPTAGLPAPGAVTMAGNAGRVLVGLSIEPARPGPNRVVVYLVPLHGKSAAATLVANLIVGTATRPLTSCGDTCRQAPATLRGGETLDVDVLNPEGGRASFIVPTLPAPLGDALITRMQQRMRQLHSYQLTETLSSGAAPVVSTYTAEAPNRLSATVNGSFQTIFIGTTQYNRESPSQPWTVTTGVPEIAVPSFVWDYFAPLTDAHIVGHESLGGVPTTEVSGFGNKQGTALWFHFWIDGDGLVRQVRMTAAGHFMVDRYEGLDVPVQIGAPVPTHTPSPPS
jgi:copper transport protein